MEVVHRGIPERERDYQGTCYSCKSVIRAKSKELKHESDHHNDTSHMGRCPVCGNSMSFEEFHPRRAS